MPAGRPDLLLAAASRSGTDRELAAQFGSAGRRYSDKVLSVGAALDATSGGSRSCRQSRRRSSGEGVTSRRALITGITGQDGSYLAELLLAKGYEVHGVIRRVLDFNTVEIDHLYVDPHTPGRSAVPALRRPARRDPYGRRCSADSAGRDLPPRGAVPRPGQLRRTRVHSRDHRPRHAADARGIRAARGRLPLLPGVEFGDVRQLASPAGRGSTPFYPRSPYGVAKVFTYWVTRNYREAYGMFAVNGILFNHESPRRGETFVTRKITRAVARIKAGLAGVPVPRQSRRRARLGLRPGIRRGHVADAAGRRTRRLRLGDRRRVHRPRIPRPRIRVRRARLEEHVRFDERYLRPTEVDSIIGDATKAKSKLGWQPTTGLPELVRIMVDADVARVAQLKACGSDEPGD